MQSIGKVLIVIGILLILVGLVTWLFSDKLHWFGNLPGDIRIKRNNTTIYAPVITFLLISLVLTLIINIVRRFL